MEMWWLFSSVARYPREIFAGRWAEPLGTFFTYFMPILVVVNVPANAMVRVLDPLAVARHDHRGRGAALAEPAVLSVCTSVVSQREQLRDRGMWQRLAPNENQPAIPRAFGRIV